MVAAETLAPGKPPGHGSRLSPHLWAWLRDPLWWGGHTQVRGREAGKAEGGLGSWRSLSPAARWCWAPAFHQGAPFRSEPQFPSPSSEGVAWVTATWVPGPGASLVQNENSGPSLQN